MSEWIKTAAFVAFPFIGAVPGSQITRKSMDWYDVSWHFRHEKLWFMNEIKLVKIDSRPWTNHPGDHQRRHLVRYGPLY